MRGFMLLLVLASAVSAQEREPAGVAAYVAAARAPWSRWPDFSAQVDAVARAYGGRSFLWLSGGEPVRQASEAIAQLQGAARHGLDPEDYDARQLDSLALLLGRGGARGSDPIRFDLLLTVGFIRFIADLHDGRAAHRPLSRSMPIPSLDPAAAIRSAIEGDSVGRLVDATVPRLAQYRSLQRELARYRLLADSIPPPAPSASEVRPGDPYAGVPLLAARLEALGDLPARDARPAEARYSDDLVEAVRTFQRRHGLLPDGVLGPRTFGALNTPPARRVRQIELAMERLRWLPPLGGQRFVVVNIPAFRLFAFDSAGGAGAPSLGMRVIVGKALNTRTPVFVEQLRYLEFQPYWNVPRSILVNELLPVLRRRPAYLREHGMELIGSGDRPAGDRVTAEVLAKLAAGELRVRQRPSTRNPLGRVKFVFPNAADVYLHGTPDTALFALTRRDFSHGCIRIQEPAALAAWVLRDLPAWPADSVAAAMAARRTRRVLLSRPVPVVLFYTTAVANPSAGIAFYDDIYGHDRRLDEALRAGPAPP